MDHRRRAHPHPPICAQLRYFGGWGGGVRDGAAVRVYRRNSRALPLARTEVDANDRTIQRRWRAGCNVRLQCFACSRRGLYRPAQWPAVWR